MGGIPRGAFSGALQNPISGLSSPGSNSISDEHFPIVVNGSKAFSTIYQATITAAALASTARGAGFPGYADNAGAPEGVNVNRGSGAVVAPECGQSWTKCGRAAQLGTMAVAPLGSQSRKCSTVAGLLVSCVSVPLVITVETPS